MNTVVQVPGGAPEIAKAAEALNESKGNATYAIQIKGASPAAVNAVQKLGGPNNTVHVLEGLNTMSKTHATRKRKGTTRRSKKVLRPRVAELNRVINAVKKQRLISLAAHNVTKTHDIHPNDEKLKKYYKKVLKANILRTPFAKIVKRAAKKNVSSRA
jgi:predicted NAD/FAD-dependent oxidoreductase